jgi:hypothetical protein
VEFGDPNEEDATIRVAKDPVQTVGFAQ